MTAHAAAAYNAHATHISPSTAAAHDTLRLTTLHLCASPNAQTTFGAKVTATRVDTLVASSTAKLKLKLPRRRIMIQVNKMPLSPKPIAQA